MNFSDDEVTADRKQNESDVDDSVQEGDSGDESASTGDAADQIRSKGRDGCEESNVGEEGSDQSEGMQPSFFSFCNRHNRNLEKGGFLYCNSTQ